MANFFKWLFVGEAPDIVESHLLVNSLSPYTKTLITQNINSIVAKNPNKGFKIGKTGNAKIRVDFDDYREAPYTKMYLLYQHTSKNVISELEANYINKFKELYPRKCKNKQLHSGGGMISDTAYFYLYLVI